jgi:hypothetical protein
MKKKITVFVFFIILNVSSQTKQETESWILGKLNLYGRENSRNFKLDGNNLIYTYKNYDETFNEFIIPIWSIEQVKIESINYPNYILKFYLKNYCKNCTSRTFGKKNKWKSVTIYETKYSWENGRQVKREVPKSKSVKDGYSDFSEIKSEIKSFEVLITKSDPEEDFIARFNKAIMHLQSLYPKKPQKTETF